MQRVIPKKTKVKNTVWHAWGMVDIFVALVLFVMVFVLLTTSHYVWMVITAVVTVGLLIPTQDGIVYMILWGMLRYLMSPREYSKGAQGKKNVSTVFPLESIKKSGVVKYKDGSFARVIHIGQKNFSMLTETDQDTDIETFAGALKLMNLSQTADIVKVERAVNLDTFTRSLKGRLAAAEADEGDEKKDIRRAVLRDRIESLDEVATQRRRYISEFYLVVYGRDRLDLESVAIGMCAEIQKCGLAASMLEGRDTAVFLKNTFTRDFDEKEADGKAMKELTDWVIPKKVSFTSHGAVVDGLSQSVLAVSDYPISVGNAWGAGIFNLEDTKVVMHIRPVEQSKAIKRIDKCVSDSEVKSITSYKASETSSAETHRETMLELLESLQRDDEELFDVAVAVTAYDYDGGDAAATRLKTRRAFSRYKFRSSNLYAGQRQGFMTSSPAPYDKFTNYDRGINSSSLAAAFPFVRCYLADEDGILLGTAREGAYPFILNIWKRGTMYQNSNAMIIGKSGSGKSYFMKSFLTGEWSQGTRVVILDPENEYDRLTKNLGGRVTDVGNAREGRINPFHIYQILTDDGGYAEPAVTFNTHLKTLESFYRIVLEGITSDILELINNLTIEAYARRGIVEATDCSSFTPEMFPTFTDLLAAVDDEMSQRPGERAAQNLCTAKMFLEKFVTGRYKDIWNGPSTMDMDSGIADFDFQSLFANKNGIVANAQMLLVFRFIEQEVINARERSKRGADVRTLILVDEAHMFIDAKYPVALDFFYSMCKRIRKYGGAFMPATQSIADWNATEELKGKTSAIIKNSQYSFIFKLSAPDMNDLLDLYRAGDGFNEEEQRTIISYPTGAALFVGSTEFRTSMYVRTSPFVESLFCEDKTDA